MTPDEYIVERVDGQIDWYDKKSQCAQRWFKRFRGVEIIAAASIPLIAGFGGGAPSSTILVGVLGAIVVIITSLLGLNQFQESWIEYRTTCESLKHEKYFFLTKVKPYHEDGAFDLFVQRIESLISKENSAWSQYTRSVSESTSSKEK